MVGSTDKNHGRSGLCISIIYGREHWQEPRRIWCAPMRKKTPISVFLPTTTRNNLSLLKSCIWCLSKKHNVDLMSSDNNWPFFIAYNSWTNTLSAFKINKFVRIWYKKKVHKLWSIRITGQFWQDKIKQKW